MAFVRHQWKYLQKTTSLLIVRNIWFLLMMLVTSSNATTFFKKKSKHRKFISFQTLIFLLINHYMTFESEIKKYPTKHENNDKIWMNRKNVWRKTNEQRSRTKENGNRLVWNILSEVSQSQKKKSPTYQSVC